jgi:hypothetical protein
MKSILLKIWCVFWLVFIMPFFGIIPFLLVLDVNIGYGILYRLEGDILRLAWSIFFGDPAPGVTHTYPPITNVQYWVMIILVFTGSAFALYYCYLWLVQKHKTKKFR